MLLLIFMESFVYWLLFAPPTYLIQNDVNKIQFYNSNDMLLKCESLKKQIEQRLLIFVRKTLLNPIYLIFVYRPPIFFIS